MIHRREKFRCSPYSLEKIKKLEKDGKIELVIPYQLYDIEEENGKIKKVIAKDLKQNLRIIECDFLLPFYGLSMELGPILDWGLNLDKKHIKVDASYYQTNIEGIYAVGDIATYPGKLKLILTGFAEVSSALHHAYGRVFDGKALHFQYSTSTGVKNLMTQKTIIIDGRTVANTMSSELIDQVNQSVEISIILHLNYAFFR